MQQANASKTKLNTPPDILLIHTVSRGRFHAGDKDTPIQDRRIFIALLRYLCINCPHFPRRLERQVRLHTQVYVGYALSDATQYRDAALIDQGRREMTIEVPMIKGSKTELT